jgi:hypothetical protein
MAKPTVYLETTIPSLLVARPSKDVRMAAMQASTRLWWRNRRNDFELFCSPAVMEEVRRGDAEMARRRLAALSMSKNLLIVPEALELALQLNRRMSLPAEKQADALHVAVAAVARLDFLLTWNCAHIANVNIITKVEALCAKLGYRCPVICTTEELMTK